MASILQVLSEYIKKPIVVAILGAIVGLILGLIIGWGIWPVQWTDATPEVLRADLQEDHLRMAIDSFRVNGSQGLALQRYESLGPNAAQVLFKIKQEPGSLDPAAILAFDQLIQAAVGVPQVTAPAPEEEQASSLGTTLISIAGIILLAVIIFSAYYFIRRIFRPRSGAVSAAMQATEINRQTQRTDFQTSSLGPPITQTAFTYVLGDDLFDESLSINSQDGKFLGEIGAGISYHFGVGDPKKVTALEVWLYDQNDIETSTKVLMSEYAYTDADTRASLEKKGKVVLMEHNNELWLETNRLKVLVKVIDYEYGEGSLPPNSFFQRATVEFSVWEK